MLRFLVTPRPLIALVVPLLAKDFLKVVRGGDNPALDSVVNPALDPVNFPFMTEAVELVLSESLDKSLLENSLETLENSLE